MRIRDTVHLSYFVLFLIHWKGSGISIILRLVLSLGAPTKDFGSEC